MVDLHTHTLYSDGTWDVKTLLLNASNNGVELLSITDHNTVKAHLELRDNDYSDYFKGRILTGAEFGCVFNDMKIELLGYNFDVDKMNDWLEVHYNNKNKNSNLIEEFRLLMEACHKNNIKIDNINYRVDMGWPTDVIFYAIKKYSENKIYFSDKEWDDDNYFFRCCTNKKDFPLYINCSYKVPNAKLVSNKIRELGGKVFLAHLFVYSLNNHERYLNELVKENIIDGVEVYYSKFTDEQIEFLEKYCQKNNLFMSVGSDCHGDKKPERKVGIGYGNMNVQIDAVDNWVGLYNYEYNRSYKLKK